uniref:Uncharacterized protein n=1 Tax=uncultured Desulfobacterium sp. TaxID=201089 RepID=E1YCX3_9BACT|nr:hypothetical protein N47_G37410 [uncultured Desulfobacterium sp.]
MAYTPELSRQASCTLRRIAWALNIPMTKAIEKVFEHMPFILDNKKVCQGCRDKSKCAECSFHHTQSNKSSLDT